MVNLGPHAQKCLEGTMNYTAKEQYRLPRNHGKITEFATGINKPQTGFQDKQKERGSPAQALHAGKSLLLRKQALDW